MRERIRRALRQIFVIGIAIGVVLGALNQGAFDFANVFACLLTGLLFAVPAWAIYRLGRFMVVRH